ncbi:gastrula zinc finger protein XlCGF57.1-like [Thalassophryne amazonica]|uniref:gastrula zinc finger protein XlCGF57.1-like n=1 Tax=Thalassophryne amazonica TaxID=390379 RepID=UPI001471567E|nr:gastrula zinc finger protein XlCGF57.1-like [Thalassophryne amazonica]
MPRPGVWERTERPLNTDPTEMQTEPDDDDPWPHGHDYCATSEPAALDLSLNESDELREEISRLWKQIEEITISSKFDFPESKTAFDDLSGESKLETTPLTFLKYASESCLLHSDLRQMLVSKEEIHPEQQDRNLIVDQKYIKEEQEELWTSQEGEQHHKVEEADIPELPFTVVLVKCENAEDEPQSRVHQNLNENKNAGPLISSSTVRRTLTAKIDGEDCGGPHLGSNLNPYSCLQPNIKSSHSDSCETDDNGEGKHIKEHFSGINCLKNCDASGVDSRGNSSEGGKALGHFSKQHGRIQANEKHASPPEWAKLCRRKGYLTIKRSHTAGKMFGCFDCGKRFNDESDRNRHRKIHAGQKPFCCCECGKRFRDKNSLSRHMTIHTGEKPFGCCDCGKRFGVKSNLSSHMRIHTGEKPFSCVECGKCFQDKNNMNIHMRIHTGDKPFVCSECGKRFRGKDHLNSHKRIHTGDKPFGCSVCSKRFRGKTHLDRHLISHTREKPFGCSECGKRFGGKVEVNAHMRIHTGEKPFGCVVCDKRFRQKGHLDGHMKIHKGEKPFGCSVCGKRFRRKGDMNRHVRIHTGEKPFGCFVCNKRFGDKRGLNCHMRTHTGEKPFGCSVCGKRFGDKSGLNRHVRIHTEQVG